MSATRQVVIAFLILSALIGIGCDKEAIERFGKPSGEPKQEITPQQIESEFDSLLRPFYEYVESAKPNTILAADYGQTLKEQLQALIKKHSGSDAGAQALRKVQYKLEDLLIVARDTPNAGLTSVLCELLESIDPDNTRIDRFRMWATVQQNRPIVVIRGWYEPLDVDLPIVYVFVKVYLPEANKVETRRIREGEEFLGLKFLKILGRKKGIRLEYKATGDVFEVYGP